jgi:uncharacterized membrane protein
MASPATGPTNVGVPPNVGGLLCYAPCCIGLVFSIVVAVIEKQSRFLRFHAFQSLLFHAVLFVLGLVVNIGFAIIGHVVPFFGLLVIPVQGLIFLVSVIATVMLMIKAYNGEEWELPTLGALARQWV